MTHLVIMILTFVSKLVLKLMLMLILRQITGIVYLIVLKTYYNLSQILQQKLAYQDAQLSPVFSVKFKILDV